MIPKVRLTIDHRKQRKAWARFTAATKEAGQSMQQFGLVMEKAGSHRAGRRRAARKKRFKGRGGDK